jgi:tetratricopeptide (TPR) repeat protein
VYWPGNVNCYLDYIVVDDGTANDLFGGSSDSLIDQEVNLFKTYSGLGRFQIVDEVPFQHYGSYLCVGRVDQRIKSNVIASGYPTKTGFHWNNSYWSQQQQLVQRDIAWTQSNQSASDIYPIYAGVSLPYDPMYTTNFQSQIQNNLINYLLMNITAANLFNVPFWFTPQVDSWPHDFREPTVTELRQMVNLGLAYGAKGIDYFLYWSAIDTGGTAEGLVETDGSPRGIIYGGTSYAGNKWETVKSINQQLSLLGPTLVGLRWQNAFSIHNGPPTETYISNVSTDADAANLTYVELGLFTDAPANRYFMLVNRRTLNGESRNITAAFSLPITSGNTWEVSDVVSGNLWVVPYNGSFTDSLNPGSAKLYKVTPSTATWSGTKTLANNVTVSIGATLTILPGTSVLLPTGSSITINGTLTSVGTISQPITFDRTGTSGTYYGLALQPGSTGTFSYCKFNNAYVGVTCYSSNVSINNSTFTNCTGGVTVSGASPTINGCVFLSNYFGVYLVNSNPSIVNCDIENSANSGMYLSNAAPTIQYNTLKNNQQSGIWFHNFSSPSNIYHNNISGSSEGFYCDGQSSPHALYGCNAMNSGYTQIYAYYGCLPVLGNANSSGLNSFDGSPYTYVNANSSSVVTAVYNWWGISSPNPSLFYSDATSSVVWSPSLNYDPNPGRPKVDIQSPTPTAGPFADSTFNLAYQTYQAGRYSDAISLCLKVYLANTSAPSMAKMALLFLADAYERSGQTDFLTYLTSNITAKATLIPDLALVERELQAHWLVKGGRYSDAIATYKGITTDFAGNPDASKFALFNMGETYNFYLNDPVHAKIALQQFKSKYPSDRLATVANFILSGSAGVPAPSKQNAGGSNGSPNTTPTGFALESNYPNPFNPSTQISYLLPEAGNVSLVIYDVLGREVANLADGYQQAGRYTVTWNSTRTSGIPVASGVYFARLRILNDLGTVKFAKTTRLLLMK